MTEVSNPLSTGAGKSPLLAALLSALFCGLGQVYNGRMLRGVVLFALMTILWVIGSVLGFLTFGLGMVPFAIVAGALWLFGIVDAYLGSRKVHRA